nr:hypothetical protein [Tanacetum cinerariifolium]
MDAPTFPVSVEKNLGDPIDIRVDIVHLTPADVFPAATVEMNALRFRMGMVEEENASLRGSIKTMEAIDTITHRQEKKARMKLKRQLTSVQESQRQDQENFMRLQEIMPTTRQGANVFMTLEAVQAMIDQTLIRNNTTNDGSQNSSGGPRRPPQPAHVCSYTDFIKYKPLNFKGTEGVVKFATCTLLGAALTWWNGHVRTLGHDAAYAMTWEILKKKLTDKYCPKGEIKKLEIELWNLKVKGNDVGGYTQRFQQLALLCTKFISNETEKVDKPKTLNDAIELANDLMDKKLRTYAERQAENKRKLDNNHQAQQQLLKKQNVAQDYAVGTGEKKSYGGSKPLCPKCNYHYDGECAPKCTNCKKISHLTKDCWHPINANNQRTITFYECENQGHYRSDCPVLKNQGTEVRGMVYALGGGETNQDLDNTEDDINA